MKLSLFHAPYVDDAGMDRMRLSGVLTGADPCDDLVLIRQIQDALARCSEKSTVLVVDDSIEVEWL